ncbi:MAG: peroxiredoxin [Fibrobacterota bacterium]
MNRVGFIFAVLCICTAYSAERGSLLPPGTQAPEFVLESDAGEAVSLQDFKGTQYVVLVFYPGNNTPVCTRQLCELRDSYDDLQSNDMAVLGINNDTRQAHRRFREEQNYQFPLLIDEENIVAKAYGAVGRLGGTERSVYVIDTEGEIIFSERGRPSVSEIVSIVRENAQLR